MINDEEETVVKLLKMTDDQQKIAIRKFSKLTTCQRIGVMQEHRKIFYVLKQRNKQVNVNTLSYLAFIRAILVLTDEDNLNYKVTKLRSNFKKSHSKFEILLERWALIKELRTEHTMSFRDISSYLLKYHKIKIAHSTIFEMWQKLEKNKDGKNG